LSSLRTIRNRKPSKFTPKKFTLKLAGSAVAVAAFASGAAATALAVPAGPSVAPHGADVPAGPAGVAGQPAADSPVSPASLASLVTPRSRGDVALLAYAAVHRTPRQVARRMLPHFHWNPGKQFKYLRWLWQRESGWNKYARNPYSGAYGIPQALPGSKMASAGNHWRTNATTQIRWGLRYIRGRYGSPRRAWNHSQAYGWY
jgi:hypothetical protein